MLRAVFKTCASFCRTKSISIPPPPAEGSELIRLSKYMSLKAICSRREAEEIIKLGLVRVDGKRVFENIPVPYEAEMKAFTPLGIEKQKPVTRLWMVNKPRGYICTHSDPQRRPTIYSLFNFSQYGRVGHMMTIGRLDFNSEGLILLTNDNVLKQMLEHPSADLNRFYRVKVHGRVTNEKLQKMSHPIMIKGVENGPLNVKVDRQLSTNVWLNVGLKTGKNNEIRRIMQKCDLQVNKLIREEFGSYKLGSLQHGQIMEVPINQNLDRKLKHLKAKKLKQRLGGSGKALVEIDIREGSIKFAKNQQKMRALQEHKKQAQLEQQKGKLIGTTDKINT